MEKPRYQHKKNDHFKKDRPYRNDRPKRTNSALPPWSSWKSGRLPVTPA